CLASRQSGWANSQETGYGTSASRRSADLSPRWRNGFVRPTAITWISMDFRSRNHNHSTLVQTSRPFKTERTMKRLISILVTASAMLWISPGIQAGEEFYGILESRPEGKVGNWVIGGRQVAVTEKTKLEEDDGPLVVGACVEVEF